MAVTFCTPSPPSAWKVKQLGVKAGRGGKDQHRHILGSTLLRPREGPRPRSQRGNLRTAYLGPHQVLGFRHSRTAYSSTTAPYALLRSVCTVASVRKVLFRERLSGGKVETRRRDFRFRRKKGGQTENDLTRPKREGEGEWKV